MKKIAFLIIACLSLNILPIFASESEGDSNEELIEKTQKALAQVIFNKLVQESFYNVKNN